VPYTGSFPKGTGFLKATLTVAGINRTVHIYKPTSAGSKPPLLLAFHGTNGDPKYLITSSYAKKLADAKGVVVLAPQARWFSAGDWDHPVGSATYWETYPNTKLSTNKDLQLVPAMIQEAAKAYGVDLKRVYTLGWSSGGFFSLLVAMTLQNQIAAFSEASAGLVRCANMWSCTFSGTALNCADLAKQTGWCSCTGAEKPGPVATSGRKPPGYLVHSNDDNVVSVQYTCELSSRMKALGYQRSVKIWTGGYHSLPYNYAVDAWAYMSKYTLP
jgi:poly(3-hydroxybutyrate) depolymerase